MPVVASLHHRPQLFSDVTSAESNYRINRGQICEHFGNEATCLPSAYSWAAWSAPASARQFGRGRKAQPDRFFTTPVCVVPRKFTSRNAVHVSKTRRLLSARRWSRFSRYFEHCLCQCCVVLNETENYCIPSSLSLLSSSMREDFPVSLTWLKTTAVSHCCTFACMVLSRFML